MVNKKNRWSFHYTVTALYFVMTIAWVDAARGNPEAAAPSNNNAKYYLVNVPSSNVAEALNSLAEQTEALFMFPYDIAESLPANPVTGQFSILESLERILKGSGLVVDLSDTGVVRIRLTDKASTDNKESKEMKSKKNILAAMIALVVGTSGVNTKVLANDGGSEARTLEEVVVTATKRGASTLTDTPMAIQAISGDALTNAGIEEFGDYARRITGLSFEDNGPGDKKIILRGMNSTGAATTALYFDEMVITGGNGQDGGGRQPDLKLVDMERIEVLKGPQGTLYGASSMSGTIRMITKKPNLEGLEVKAAIKAESTSGGDMLYGIDTIVNVPLSEQAAIRGVIYTRDGGGYVDNLHFGEDNINSEEVAGGRLSFLWQTDTVTFNLMGLHQQLDSDGSSWYFPFVGENQVSNHNRTPWSEEIDALSASMEIGLNSGSVSLSASQIQREILFLQPATRKFCFLVTGSDGCKTQQESESLDAWRTALIQPQEKAITSFEARYSSDWESPFQMVAGVYYSEEKNDFRSTITRIDAQGINAQGVSSIILDRSTDSGSEQKAIFTEMSYDLTDRLTVLGGLRYFEIESEQVGQTHTAFFGGAGSGSPAVNADSDDDGVTLKLNVAYDLSNDSLIYASYSEGFRTGGVNEPDFANDPARPKGYESDSLESYEFGIKSTALEGRLNYEVAAYFMQWDDIQTRRILASSQFLGNSGSADILGLEIGGQLLLGEAWTIGTGLTFTQAELSEDDDLSVSNRGLEGDRIPYVPSFSGNIFAEYEWSLDFCDCDAVLHGDVSYVGESYSALNSTSPVYRKFGDYTLANMRAVITVAEKYTYALYVNNLLDEHGRVTGYLDAARPDAIVATAPRSIGAEVLISF